MIDLTIDTDHTFYVALTTAAVLVHNQNCELSSPNPVTNKSIRNEYEEITTGNGTPRIDPATGQQTIHRGGVTTQSWAGAKEWDVPGTSNRILEKTLADGRKIYGYVENHNYRVVPRRALQCHQRTRRRPTSANACDGRCNARFDIAE